jgi:hypothetical protein
MKIIEISQSVETFRVDKNDPNFYRPISELFKDYGENPNYKTIITL